MFFYGGGYSTVQIKKWLLNQLIPRKSKSFIGKKEKNLDKKNSQYEGFQLLHSWLYYSFPGEKE